MLDIAPNGIYAKSFGVSEHLLNRGRQTATEADAEQTAMQRTQSRNAVEIWAENSGMKRAITDAYATMTSPTATTTVARS